MSVGNQQLATLFASQGVLVCDMPDVTISEAMAMWAGLGVKFWPGDYIVIYCGQDGVINYDTIVATMGLADDQVTIVSDLPPSTIWHYVRRQVSGCGLESDDSPACVVHIIDTGDAVGITPNQPTGLIATAMAGGKAKLQWRYSAAEQAVKPSGFYVYINSGAGFDFDTPDGTVSAVGISRAGGVFSWTSDALTHGTMYRFCVRSYAADGGETQNTNTVSIVADAVGPAAIEDVSLSWQEI